MSKQVDNRIVQMQFNNKQFETNAKQSLNTLEKLKNALNFSKSTKGLDSLDKSVKTTSLDRIADSVEALQKRFSFLGETARKVVNSIASTLTGTLGKAVTYVQDSIVSGGTRRAMNLENAHFQLQALLKDEAKVQEVMDNANTAVDGTAYSFDEAAKAASMFSASGLKAGDEMTNALRGIVGTAAMTNSAFEDISLIFTAVAGQGRLMGDQLLQLSGRGLNAAATIAEFFNGVNDGSKQASEEVTAAIKKLSKGAKMAEGDIRDLTSEGAISFKIFSEAMTEAFADSAEKANETFTGALSNIKSALARIGAGFISPLVEQNSKIVRLFNVIREKTNEVKAALVFDETVGNVQAYSKRFTDSVLSMAKSVTKFIKHLDIAKGMKVFYNVVDTIINLVKGLGSVLAPVGKAFANVFLSLNVKQVIQATKYIKQLSEGFKLSENASKNLQDTFEGLFSIVKLVADIFINVLQAIMPVNGPVLSLSGGILELTGSLGRSITAMVEWIQESEAIEVVCSILATGLSLVSLVVVKFIESLKGIARAADEFGLLEKAVGLLVYAFQTVGSIAEPYIDILVKKAKEFSDVAKVMVPKTLASGFKTLIEWIGKAKDAFAGFSIKDLANGFDDFRNRLDKLFSSIGATTGFKSLLGNLKEFGTRIKEVFDFQKIINNIETFRKVVEKYVTWFGEVFGRIFTEASPGSVVAGAGGIAIFKVILDIAKALEKTADKVSIFDKIPKVIGSLSDSIDAYQKKVKAEALKEAAKATIILAGALVVLSLVDTERVMGASVALGVVAGVLLVGLSKLQEATNKGSDVSASLGILAKGLSKSMRDLTKAVKYKAIGSAFKDFGAAIALVAGSLIALGLMYRKDADAMNDASKLVAIIATVMVGVMASMSIITKKTKSSGDMLKSALSIGVLAGALASVVKTLRKLFKMDLPDDYGAKLAILAGILVGLTSMVGVMAKASKTAGGNKIASGPILAMSVLLLAIVSSLKKLFKMDLPSDYGEKLLILAGIFVGLDSLILTLGKAAEKAGGTIKAAGTILSLAALIGTITGSLMILSLIPGEGMLKGAVALGGVLLAVSAAINSASKVTGEDTYKTVLAMAATVGTICVSLGILSMIPMADLLVSAGTLGALLLALATNFNAIGSITNESAWQTVVAMIGVMVTIAGSLYILSSQPWEQMLAAGASMSAVLVAFAIAFKSIGEYGDSIDPAAIAKFLATTLAVIPIGVALYELSTQPWEGMLAAGVSLTAVVLAFTAAFAVISKSNPDVAGIGKFLLATTALIPVSIALYTLAEKPWEQMLAAGASISAVVLAMSAAMAICTAVGNTAMGAIKGIGLLDLFIANFAVVLASLGKIFEDPAAQKLLNGGGQILADIGYAIGDFVGSIVGGALAGITSGLPEIGANLTGFMNSAQGFFEQASKIDDSAMKGVKYMAEAILLLTASDLISGLTSWLTGGSSLQDFGTELEAFAPHMAAYATAVAGLDGGVVKNSANAAKALSEMAKGLPNSGGLAAKIFGDNSLAEFGIELASFGPHLMEYANSISGLDAKIVTNSANAASSLSELAKNLPDSGGLAAKIFGDSSLSDFGSELAEFGPYLAEYAEAVKNVDPKVVTATATAAQALAALDEAIPESGGVKGMFSGTKDMAAFGESLVSFGEGISGYYDEVASIDTGTLSSSTEEIKKLADMVKGLDGIDATSATGFVQALKTLGDKSITAFTDSFVGASDKVKTAVEVMVIAAGNAIQNQASSFKQKGTSSASAYAQGISSKKNEVSSSANALVKAFMSALQTKTSSIKQSGTKSASAWIAGIKGKFTEVGNVTRNFVNQAIKVMDAKKSAFTKSGTDSAKAFISGLEKAFNSAFNTTITKMVNNGKRLVEGIAKGINQNMGIAQKAASQLATKIDEQVKSDLDIHSPSKKGELRGEQYDTGIEIGLTKNMYKPINAAKAVATTLDNVFGRAVKTSAERVGNMVQKAAQAIASSVKNESYRQEKGSTASYDQYLVTQQHLVSKEESYWEKLLKVKQQGADAEKYIDMDLIEFRKTIQEESNAIINEYNNQVESVKKSVSEQLSLFSEVDDSLMRTRKEQEAYEKEQEEKQKKQKKNAEETTKQTASLTEGLEDQIKVYDKYTKTMDSLLKKLKNTSLLEYIKDQGVDALPYLIELNNMTDAELEKYTTLYEQKLMYAHGIAKMQLTDLYDETKKKAEELYSLDVQNADRDEELKEQAVEAEKGYWEKLLDVKKQGAESEQYLDTSIEEFRASILEKTSALLKEYEDQLKSTRDSIMSQMDLFTAVEEKEAVTQESLFEILEGQITAYQQYADVMASLSQKLAGTNLLDQIKEMGVTSLDQLKVFDQMSEESLSEYVSMYDQKLDAAEQAAATKIQEVKNNTEKELKELFGTGGEVNLDDFTKMFDGSFESIEKYVEQIQAPIDEMKQKVTEFALSMTKELAASGEDVMQGMSQLGEDAVGAFVEGLSTAGEDLSENVTVTILQPIKEREGEFQEAGESIAANTVAGIQKKETDFEIAGSTEGSKYTTGVKNKYQESNSTGTGLSTQALNGVNMNKDAFRTAGQNAGQGYVDGILSMVEQARAAAAQLAAASSTSTAETLDEHSPSKVFGEIGKNAALGYIYKFMEYISVAANASKEFANASVDEVNNAFTNLSPIYNDEFYDDPVITPQVDLSNVRQSAVDIRDIFNRAIAQTSLGAAGVTSAIREENARKSTQNNETKQSEQPSSGNIYELNQYNYSPKALSQTDIYRQTKNLFTLFETRVATQ